VELSTPGIIGGRPQSGYLSDEKENQVRELDFTDIHSQNILFIFGNKVHARSVCKIEQVKNL
jgi:hypothetical protein